MEGMVMATQREQSTRVTEKVPTVSAVRRVVPPALGDSAKKTEAPLSQEQRHVGIELAAYYLAERRGFEPGHEIEDWLTAEAETDRALLD
jgi:hypothetical protein